MQTYIVLIACVILLLCLFFRVPVYISVFAAALTYFLFQTGSSPAIIAQRNPEHSITGNSVFHLCGNLYELFRCNETNYEFL